MDPVDKEVNRINMIFEEKRFESYKRWPFSDKEACSIRKLAEAGFFWTGTAEESDSAQCFVCNKSLDGWESSDDPWFEHKKHSPECPFIVIDKKEDDLTLDQFYDLWRIMMKNLAKAKVAEYDKEIMIEVDSIRNAILNYKKTG